VRLGTQVVRTEPRAIVSGPSGQYRPPHALEGGQAAALVIGVVRPQLRSARDAVQMSRNRSSMAFT
jgi:hypothetical protein